MLSARSARYWRNQMLGWGLLHGLLAMQSLQAIAAGQETPARVLILSPASWLLTVFASHCLYVWAVRNSVSTQAIGSYWPRLVPLVVLVALATAVCYWLLLQGLALFLPPPATRSAFIGGVFDSFLLFTLNFTLVNLVLLALWWAVFITLAGQQRARAPTPAPSPVPVPETTLSADSPIMISDGKSSRLITPSHIEYAFAEGNYVKLVGAEVNMLIRATLSHLEQRLAQARFFRINRQTLVNLTKVRAIDEAISGNYLLILESGKQVEASRRQGKELQRLLSL